MKHFVYKYYLIFFLKDQIHHFIKISLKEEMHLTIAQVMDMIVQLNKVLLQWVYKESN